MTRKKKTNPDPTSAGFRLDDDEQLAYKKYCEEERYPLAVSDLAHRVFRDWLIKEKLLIEQKEPDIDPKQPKK